jgi:hypothetical protein
MSESQRAQPRRKYMGIQKDDRKGMSVLSIRIPDDLKKRLVDSAWERRTSITAQVVGLLRRSLGRPKKLAVAV